jgi:Flp pilus assembly protein TadD
VKRLVVSSLVLVLLVAAASVFAAPAPAPAATAAVSAPVDSLAMLEKTVAKDSTKFDNLYNLGVMYLDRDRMVEAINIFAKANQLQPKNVKVMVNLGIAADAVGHSDEAQGWYGKALAVSPDDPMAMCRMASSKYAQAKYDDAMADIRAILAKNPKSHCAYFTLGVAFADAGIYRDAIRMWRKVVELAPDSPEAVSAKESIDVLEKFLQGK